MNLYEIGALSAFAIFAMGAMAFFLGRINPELFMITCLFTKSTALAVEATLDASPYQQIF